MTCAEARVCDHAVVSFSPVCICCLYVNQKTSNGVKIESKFSFSNNWSRVGVELLNLIWEIFHAVFRIRKKLKPSQICLNTVWFIVGIKDIDFYSLICWNNILENVFDDSTKWIWNVG